MTKSNNILILTIIVTTMILAGKVTENMRPSSPTKASKIITAPIIKKTPAQIEKIKQNIKNSGLAPVEAKYWKADQ